MPGPAQAFRSHPGVWRTGLGTCVRGRGPWKPTRTSLPIELPQERPGTSQAAQEEGLPGCPATGQASAVALQLHTQKKLSKHRPGCPGPGGLPLPGHHAMVGSSASQGPAKG